MKDFTDQDIQRIEQAIETRDQEAARREIRELHPADIAELFGELNLRQAEWLFNLIEGTETKADVLMELDEEERKKILEGMNPEEIGHYIDPARHRRRRGPHPGAGQGGARRGDSPHRRHGAGRKHRGPPPV